jgi:Uma2 family endonuclease
MNTVIIDETSKITIPAWVTDVASFRQWADSDEFPQEGRIWFIRGGVWADMSKEQVFSHNQVKKAVAYTLTRVELETESGRFFPDGLRLTNRPAELSGVPDGMYVTFKSLRAGRANYVESKDGGYTELDGVPDVVIEVVSRSSVDKDTEWLQKMYWEAGIPEYWLIDARRSPPAFDIFRHTAKGYAAARKQAGWVKSAVLGKTFRLTAAENGMGYPKYTLEVR